jgi:hypothetical protein
MAAIMPDSRAFRLLNLPVELRLMVYERLPGKHYSFLFEIKTDSKAVTTHHITVQGSLYHNHTPMVRMEHPTNTITLVTKTCETSILATCRAVNLEATRVLGPRLEKLRTEPARIIVDLNSMDRLVGQGGILEYVRSELFRGHSDTSRICPILYPHTGPTFEFRGNVLHGAHVHGERLALVNLITKAAAFIGAPFAATGQWRFILISVTMSAEELLNPSLTYGVTAPMRRLVLPLPFGVILTPLAEHFSTEQTVFNFTGAHECVQAFGINAANLGMPQHNLYVRQDWVNLEKWDKEWDKGEDV